MELKSLFKCFLFIWLALYLAYTPVSDLTTAKRNFVGILRDKECRLILHLYKFSVQQMLFLILRRCLASWVTVQKQMYSYIH